MNKVIIKRSFILISVILSISFIASLFGGIVFFEMPPIDVIKVLSPAILCGAFAGMLFLPIYSSHLTEDITKPIKAIGNRLKLIEQGDYNIILSYPREDEVAPVINAINNLTKNVSSTMYELTIEKQRIQYILNNMESGLLLIDSELTIQQYNNAVGKYFSFEDDIIGKPLSTLTEEKKIISAVGRAVTSEISSVFDVDLMESAGSILSVRVNPTFGAWAGSVRGVSAIVFFNNVTEARKMENMRSEFIANISHELKTPITSIKGFAELLTAGVVSDEVSVQGYLGRMKDEADRMSSLIDDILRLSSLESAIKIDKPVNIDLKAMAEDIVFNLTPQINRKNITVNITGTGFIKAISDDMHQLLKNLIENAVNYNAENGSVYISLSSDTSKCKITVSDTGIGIPAEHQPRIFERFYRVDKSRSKREGGTGLGLSIVKHITAKYQGQITLTSKVDEGTTIKVAIPVTQSNI